MRSSRLDLNNFPIYKLKNTIAIWVLGEKLLKSHLIVGGEHKTSALL
jgi:hypothetical protein